VHILSLSLSCWERNERWALPSCALLLSKSKANSCKIIINNRKNPDYVRFPFCRFYPNSFAFSSLPEAKCMQISQSIYPFPSSQPTPKAIHLPFPSFLFSHPRPFIHSQSPINPNPPTGQGRCSPHPLSPCKKVRVRWVGFLSTRGRLYWPKLLTKTMAVENRHPKAEMMAHRIQRIIGKCL
jgi:hypothetical protein